MQAYGITDMRGVSDLKLQVPCCGGAKGHTGTGIVFYVYEKDQVQVGPQAAVDECSSGIGA